MKDIFVVMQFTMKDMLKRKSFIISTIIILILIVVGFNVPKIINSFTDGNYNEKITLVDSDNVFEGNLESLKNMDIGYDITIDNRDIDTIKKDINDEKINSALVITKDNDVINLDYIVKDMSMFYATPDVLINTLNSLYTNIQINKLGLSTEVINMLMPNFNVTTESINTEVEGNVFVIMLLSIVLFYAIYFCAYQVSSSITTEKTSKIMETLVTSTSPKTIVLGKTMGIGLVGLLQLILIVATALISAKLSLDKALLATVLDLHNITIYLGIVTIIYFILGYFVFALLYALTGSTISKPEDIQSANSPIVLIAMVGFYLSYFTMMNPTSNLNVFASMFPISSPFCMPFRVMMGLASPIEVLLSLVILIVTNLIIAKIAIKIYSNAILNYGTKLSIKDMINIYKQK